VLLISASPGGAAHAHGQLLEVLRTMSMQVIDGGGHVFSRAKLDAQGAITAPELVDALARGFAQLAEACAAQRAGAGRVVAVGRFRGRLDGEPRTAIQIATCRRSLDPALPEP